MQHNSHYDVPAAPATLRTMEPFCGPHYRPDGPRSA